MILLCNVYYCIIMRPKIAKTGNSAATTMLCHNALRVSVLK